MEPLPSDKSILLFDGVCNLCNGAVNFVIDRDADGQVMFAPLQSDVGRELLVSRGLNPDALDSLVLIEEGQAFQRSTAALRVARHLDGPWRFLYAFRVVPRVIRDAVYDLVARSRYSMFGKQDACRLPTPDERARFLVYSV
ncbi:MAG: thiol-disulfide oxidoreductase DCC family protein [Bacteroidota bacterium]